MVVCPAVNAGHGPTTRAERSRLRDRLRRTGTVLLYALMLAAILALWNNDAPEFIYVAF